MMSNRVRVWVLFLAIIALSRFWSLGQIPPGLNRDEAAIGYNAYSILKTGRDEYGKPFPLQLKSFGDWKLPLYPYLTIPFIRILGLNQLAIRLPSAFFGWATVAIFPIFTVALLRKFKLVSSPGEAWVVGMIAGVILAFSPWQFHFSHLASEANLAVFLFSLGFWLFLRSFEKPGWFWWGAVFLLLTLLAYHGAHVFMPLFFMLLLVIFTRELRKVPSGRERLGLVLAVAVIFVGVFSFRSDRAKLSGLFILDQKGRLHLEIDLPRSAHRNHFIGRLFHNKLTFLSRELPLNLAETFSPQFLLRSGGRNRAHNVPGFGNFLISAAVLAAAGALVSFRLEQRLFAFLLGWSLLAALPSAITFDSPHTTRAAFMVIPLSLFGGIGGWWIWRRRKNVLN
jgi:4-amino-4-deoxy-L-arabinose transferase-like glycosyltransferase